MIGVDFDGSYCQNSRWAMDVDFLNLKMNFQGFSGVVHHYLDHVNYRYAHWLIYVFEIEQNEMYLVGVLSHFAHSYLDVVELPEPPQMIQYFALLLELSFYSFEQEFHQALSFLEYQVFDALIQMVSVFPSCVFHSEEQLFFLLEHSLEKEFHPLVFVF